MVQKSTSRLLGANLRMVLQKCTTNRFTSFLSGIVVTFFLQSSTATILLSSSFAKNNYLTLPMALAIVIGADLSTTLIAQILTFDLSWLSPAFMIIGHILHSNFSDRGYLKRLAAIFIGLSLMLLSLAMIRESMQPLVHSETLPYILKPLQYDPILALLIGAFITWLMHSSLAAVLLFSSIALSGAVPLELGLYLILGANLGGAFIAFILMIQDVPAARRIPLGNLMMRLATVAIVFFLINDISAYLKTFGDDPARMLVHFHTGFNLFLAILFLPLVRPVAKLCKKIFPDNAAKTEPGAPMFLDEKALDTPVIALAGAARETLRMAEHVETMLLKTISTFKHNDTTLIDSIRREDDVVDKIYENIKFFIAKLSREALDTGEADRCMQIITFSTNLEYAGDIIEKNLMDLAQKKTKKNEHFSPEGMAEIENFHKIVLENMQLAQNIFMLQDPELARSLVQKKQNVRDAVQKSSDQHFQRLSEGKVSSIATSALHLDIIRDYRRINTYMTAVAYSILDKKNPAMPSEDRAIMQESPA